MRFAVSELPRPPHRPAGDHRLGFANRSLMDGDLLIAGDVYYKLWETAAYEDVFVNQWAFAVGTQLTRGNKIPPGLLVQHQSDQPQRGRPTRRLSHRQGRGSAIPGGQHGRDQPAPDHRRHRPAGFPGAESRPGLVRRRTVQRHGRVRPPPQTSVAIYYVGMGMTWHYGDPNAPCGRGRILWRKASNSQRSEGHVTGQCPKRLNALRSGSLEI